MPNCIFCEAKKTSKEHLWGNWWNQYYPPTVDNQLERGRHHITVSKHDGAKNSVGKGVLSKAGDALSRTTKVVCTNCNTTWMSEIEDGMKNAFETLFLKKVDDIDTDLSLAIRRWMLLKFCLLDRAYEEIPFPEHEAAADIKAAIRGRRQKRWQSFYKGIGIPPDFRFFVSRCGPKMQIGAFNHIPFRPVVYNRSSKVVDRLDLFDTCMFAVGHFLGVVTNVDGLANYLSNQQETAFVELSYGTAQMSKTLINADEFEETILYAVEQLTGQNLRRNYKGGIAT